MPTAIECLAPGLRMTIVPWPSCISSRMRRLTSFSGMFEASISARLLKSTSKRPGQGEALMRVGKVEVEELSLRAPAELLGVHSHLMRETALLGGRARCAGQRRHTRTSSS